MSEEKNEETPSKGKGAFVVDADNNSMWSANGKVNK